MKSTSLTLSILLILLAGGAWSEDEFPIDLTCYVWDGIIQFHLEETMKESWYLVDKDIMPFGQFALGIFGGQGKRATEKRYVKYAGKRMNDFIDLEVTNVYIKAKTGSLLFSKPSFLINRLTGSYFGIEGGTVGKETGQCYPGLEIMTERKF